MIFEILIIISDTLLSPYIVCTIQTYLDTPSTETFFDWPGFEISDPWYSLTEAEYINDILENSCKDTDCSHYKPGPLDIFGKEASNYIGHWYQAGGKTIHRIVPKQTTISSSAVQQLTVERRSNVLIPHEPSGKAVKQYQPVTNKQVPRWVVTLYNRLTSDLDGIEALIPESRSKSINIKQEMPQLVDA